MKNFFKLFGVIALVAVIGFLMAGCKNDNDDDNSDITIKETSGKLTINGLSSYNGKYVMAVELEKTDNLFAAAQIEGQKVKGGKIANGSVTLKVWKVSGTSILNYNGNDNTVEFSVTIHTAETISANNTAGYGTVTVNFTNGIGTGSFISDDDW
jgi:flagellar hook assembly protein FlgD